MHVALGELHNLIPCPGIAEKKYSQPLRSANCYGITASALQPCVKCSTMFPAVFPSPKTPTCGAESLPSLVSPSYSRVHPKTPLSCLHSTHLIEELKATRADEKKLKKQLAKLKAQLEDDKLNRPVSKEVHEGLMSVMTDPNHPNRKKIQDTMESNPLMKLFWEEQQKAFSKNPKAMRWHPQVMKSNLFFLLID